MQKVRTQNSKQWEECSFIFDTKTCLAVLSEKLLRSAINCNAGVIINLQKVQKNNTPVKRPITLDEGETNTSLDSIQNPVQHLTAENRSIFLQKVKSFSKWNLNLYLRVWSVTMICKTDHSDSTKRKML